MQSIDKSREREVRKLALKRKQIFDAQLRTAIKEHGPMETWSDMTFATNTIQTVDLAYLTMPPLHPTSKSFLDHAAKYLDCRRQMDTKYEEIDEFQKIARFSVQTDSGGIEIENNDSIEFKQEYQQQATSGTPVSSMEQLYEAAQIAEPVFKDIVTSLVDRVCTACGDSREALTLKFPPLKGRKRAREKSDDDYIHRTPDPGLSWLYDIVRGSIVFSSVDQIAACLEIMKADDAIHIVKAKNRFAKPGLSGYRDLVFHIQIDTLGGFKHICEVQIHHEEIKKLEKELQSHLYYEFFRSYFAGGEDGLKDRLNDLELIMQHKDAGKVSNGEDLKDKELSSTGEDFFESMLQRPMEASEITRFCTLFSDHLNEYDWAARCCIKLLRCEMDSDGPSSVAVADVYSRFGRILLKAYAGTMLEQAEQLHQRSLQIKTKELGEKNIALAHTHESIALVQIRLERPLEAMKHLELALEIKKNMLRGDPLSLAKTYDHMATAAIDLDEKPEAILELCQRSLEIRSSKVGEDHPDLAGVYHNMGDVLSKQSKHRDALQKYERSLELRKRHFGDDHESLMEDYRAMLKIHFEEGRLYEVKALQKKITPVIMKVASGKSLAYYAYCRENEGFVRRLIVFRMLCFPCFMAPSFKAFAYGKMSNWKMGTDPPR
ncbi:unnamed protein product [Cylindrotheca closterium]|uniref:RelA/SpoT domain-containing protein n=1 Tax=Cylindrotheca closterium TaxID=2856 RepID=A0AAD2G933_9STRA|nr:unnamed protein product [Cylindrotheca closterium]